MKQKIEIKKIGTMISTSSISNNLNNLNNNN